MNSYKTYTLIFVAAAVVTCVITPWIRRFALRLGALDQPGQRKVHLQPMPRLGGLAVFAGFVLPWTLFYLLSNRVVLAVQDYEKRLLALFLAGFAMLCVGAWDDLHGLSPLRKLFAQIAAATGLCLAGYTIAQVRVPWGGVVELGWLSIPFTVLWIVALTNAINLLDGIDGLACGVTGCIAFCLAIVSALADNILVAVLSLCLAGACAGFLPHNFHPARIFLGDAGSLFLGIALAGISVLSLFKSVTIAMVAVPLVLFALPVFDLTRVVVGRLRRGQPVLQGDRTHVHHRLLDLGWGQRRVALFLYAVTLVCGTSAILLGHHGSLRPVQYALGFLSFAFIAAWLAFRWNSLRR